eukprot:GHVR01144560.1.p1 GENE.GHVR01144560.1~~GHVR01144560.1.p1  ORF type:complete len:324 (+),score=23.70 GHVR01144560.1:25-996(+)
MDEITNLKPHEFSTLAYSMSQGRGMDRAKAGSNELRANNTTWQCMSLCSSNASFYEKMSSLKTTPEGELMRLMEYNIEKTNVLDTDYAKQMFDHQLKANFGHAGEIYATWLVQNLNEAVDTTLEIQHKLDKELGLTQAERFWSAVTAANISGGLIASKRLKLIDFDMKRIYGWAGGMLSDMRTQVKPPLQNASSVIGDFLNRHGSMNMLIINGREDRRTNLTALPILTPRGELYIRVEPDTKKMFIDTKAFRNDCVESQVSYKDTMKELKQSGAYIGGENIRLGKGLFVSPTTYSLVFDLNASDFLDVDSLVESAAEDESREG